LTKLQFNIKLKNTNNTSLKEDLELLNDSVKHKGNKDNNKNNISKEEIINNKQNSDD